MKVAIDVSQLAYQNTGVAGYLKHLVLELVKNESVEFVLFFSSLRGSLPESIDALARQKNVTLKKIKLPPSVLNIIWNVIHKVPIETFIGPIDMLITSDWTEPPSKAKKATILYDLIIFKSPEETSKKIINVQKKKLEWVKKESDMVFCISEATKNDAIQILGLRPERIKVIYPGIS